MGVYFEYLKEMIIQVFKDIGTFFVKLFAGPWENVGDNFKYYGDIFNTYSNQFGPAGWVFFVIFAIFFIALIGGLLFLLFLLLRKYIRFVKRELDKDALREEVERLSYELYKTTEEKDKILNLKVGAFGGRTVEQMEEDEKKDQVPASTILSRFPKLTAVDIEYANLNTEIPNIDGLTLEEVCNSFRGFAASQLKLYYKIDTIRQLFAGMATSKLIILEGISGTGKTSLPYALGKFLMHDASICSVQPSWKDRSELVGYYNEFTKKFNETEFLRALYESTYRKDLDVVVLDEMNLARIEYYFAEFLSMMELPNVNDWLVELTSNTEANDPKNIRKGKLLVPQNVEFFGTANNDDSTFTISDKVYDRAISIFFDNKGIPFETEFVEPIQLSYSQLRKLYQDAIFQYPLSDKVLEKFEKLDAFVIKNFKLAFGNRILKQLNTFIPVYVACGGNELDGLDFIFTNKILKKFEFLNIAFLKDELKKLNSELDKLFGKNTFKMAHNYINDLLRLN